MAISNSIPEIWSARILESFQRQNLWRNLVTDLSAEVVGGPGDKLHVTTVSSSPTVRNYTKDTDIAAPEGITDVDNVLNLDKQKYFNFQVDDIDRVQSKPDLFSYYTNLAGRKIAEQVDADISAEFANTLATAQETATAAINPGTASTFADAKLKDLITAINQVIRKLQNANWPMESTWMMVSTNVAFGLREIAQSNSAGGFGAMGVAAYEAGDLTRIFGIPVFVNPTMPTATSRGTALANFGTTESVFFASQVSKLETYRLEKRFADGVKGLFVYGTKKIFTGHVHQLQAA